ncbi:MAG: hypothetical protein L3J08_01610 [Flavobacteriaceae bacterium]|nr:hypothetical protein [Flavobacteriaceae bacterium]
MSEDTDLGFKGLLQNKVYRIGDVILCNNEAKNTGIALAKVSIFNTVSVQKNKAKCKGYFVTDPKG